MMAVDVGHKFGWRLVVYTALLIACTTLFGSQKLSQSMLFGRHSRDEITILRDRNAKHFDNYDGTVSAYISPGSIHYRKGNKWLDIDNSIEHIQDESNEAHPFLNETNAFRNYFPINPFSTDIITKYEDIEFSERIISIDFIDYRGEVIISLDIDETNIEATVDNNSIIYSGFAEEIELIYTLKNDRRKADLKILSPRFLGSIPENAVNIVIREEVAVNRQFEIVENEHGILVSIDGGNVLGYATPVCHDSDEDNGFGETAGKITATTIDNIIYIECFFDIGWINSSERLFPLYLDPTVDYFPEPDGAWTGAMWSGGAVSNYGDIRIRNDYRSWAAFNIFSMPDWAVFNSATYYGYHHNGANATAQMAKVIKLEINPMTAGNADRWAALGSGDDFSDPFVFGHTADDYGWRTAELNSDAIDFFQDILDEGEQDWVAIGFVYVEGGNNLTYHRGNTSTSNICYLQINYSEPCSGEPDERTATVNRQTSASVCYDSDFRLIVSKYLGAPEGITVKWQSAPAEGGPWSDITGATTDTFITSTTADIFYRALTTCDNSGLSTPSNVLEVTVIPLPAPPSVSPTDTTVFCGTHAVLTASGSPDDYVWFADAGGEKIVGVGETFETPPLTTATTFYVAATTSDMSLLGEVFEFKTCGAVGRLGPSQAQVDAAYSGTNLDGDVTVLGEGIQKWTVPVTGTYRVDAYGAQGGKVGDEVVAGKGARMSGEFYLVEGQVLHILVGQQGGQYVAAIMKWQASAGGGSFVVFDGDETRTEDDILVIAGGGGGYASERADAETDGHIGAHGKDGIGFSSGASGGTGGNGGASGAGGTYGGGGGFYTGGQVETTRGGRSFLSGGEGGTGSVAAVQGGFGGGGGLTYVTGTNYRRYASGGGGYSGGGAAHSTSTSSTTTAGAGGGGGGSFNNGENQNNESGVREGHGLVVIERLKPEGCLSELVAVNVDVIVPDPPTVSPVDTTVLCGTPAILTASGGPHHPNGYIWFDDAAGEEMLHIGATFETRPVLTETTFYVSATSLDMSIIGETFEFTNCGATGRFGPSQANANAEYSGTLLEGEVTIIGDGIQQWTAPATGTYQIEAFGAEGGWVSGNNDFAGKGAKISGEFSLEAGDVLRIIVGQEGLASTSSGGQGGGGGSFIVKVVASSDYEMFDGTFVEPLLVAGGGSGAPNSATYGGLDGRIDNRGHDNVSVGSSSTAGAGGGGSFSVHGGGLAATRGFSFLSGGLGGSGSWAAGGFGGGGSKGRTNNDGAGGGGFDGGDHTYAADEGGGGSFNDGENQENEAGAREGHGLVRIIAPEDICYSEFVAVTVEVEVPDPPTVSPADTAVLCGTHATLTASGSTGEFIWFADAGGEEILSYNATFETPALSTATTFYVAASSEPTGGVGGEFEFTNCGAMGRTGPSQAEANAEYSGTSLEGEVTVVDGIQYWTVPETGTYRIEAWGAQGSTATGSTGGLGAYMSGDFELLEGEVIRILVGQNAPNTPGRENLSSSGGGGSFVVRTPYDTEESILVIAGGGGGTGDERPETSNATTETWGQTGSHGSGGTDGEGGTTGNSAAGAGGGFFTSGVTTTSSGGRAYILGGYGGDVHSSWSDNGGGFGGGGSVTSGGNSRYGGGGGYSGGSGSSSSAGATSGLWGGGGGSYNSGENQENEAGVREGHGLVIIRTASQFCQSETVPVDITVNKPPTVGLSDGDYVWSGNINMDWGTASNWLVYSDGQFNVPASQPSSSDDVFIIAFEGGPCPANEPTLSEGGSFECNNLNIAEGRTLTSETASLSVYGDWNSAGTFSSGEGTIVFTGSSISMITGSTEAETFYDITVDKTGVGEVVLNRDIIVYGEIDLTATRTDTGDSGGILMEDFEINVDP